LAARFRSSILREKPVFRGALLFTVHGGEMILLHGFIKKSQAIPKDDLELAEARLKQLRSLS
jgi:phage-related protein